MFNYFKNRHQAHDPVWHVQSAMVVAIALQLALPDNFSVGTRYAIPCIELLLLAFLSLTTPKERIINSSSERYFTDWHHQCSQRLLSRGDYAQITD
jgi:hypothetical protein